jgi:hypothetical protein
MSIHVRIAHRTVGRVRLQVLEHRGDREFFDHLSQQIANSGLVQKVRANPITGSIVLEFDDPTEDLLAKLAAVVPIEFAAEGVANPTRLPAAVANSRFKLVSGRDINPMLMAGTFFSAVSVLQTLRGKVLVPALSASWYAINAFRLAHTQTRG